MFQPSYFTHVMSIDVYWTLSSYAVTAWRPSTKAIAACNN